jgi:hypothetical protein
MIHLKEKLKEIDLRSICERSLVNENAFNFSLCKAINSLGPRYYSRTIDYIVESSSGIVLSRRK